MRSRQIELTRVFETQRFTLREFGRDDLDDLAAMVADEDQMRFYPRPKTRAEASAWISRNLSLYEEYGFGVWLIESLPTPGFLGYCGIRPLALEGASEVEIGWHTKKTSWNQGVATEAATAARDLAFGHFALSRLAERIPAQETGRETRFPARLSKEATVSSVRSCGRRRSCTGTQMSESSHQRWYSSSAS